MKKKPRQSPFFFYRFSSVRDSIHTRGIPAAQNCQSLTRNCTNRVSMRVGCHSSSRGLEAKVLASIVEQHEAIGSGRRHQRVYNLKSTPPPSLIVVLLWSTFPKALPRHAYLGSTF